MTNTAENNKRIAKNTLLLYFRMIFLLAISLYTSRIVLQTLGIEDYGIYNVVGGIVTMFAFLNNAMGGATQRYLNFDLAQNNIIKLKETFNTALIIHTIIAFIIIFLSETIGLWFLYEKMVIPPERMNAALWVYQCSILIMAINIISVPYNAAIIAHEKMGAFAYISILEASLKLIIVYLLYISHFDKLIIYATLLLIISIIIRFVYTTYSHKNFIETHFHFIWNKKKIKEMGSFASWNLIGNLALIGVTQGSNILLNIFFGPTINAARGVAVQVQSAIQQFAISFQTAINPQITKSFASKQLEYMHSLICRSSKFSFLMVLLLSLPFIIMTDYILSLWLGTPPNYTAIFLKIILINAMIDCFSNPLNNAMNATGKIRSFQLCNGLLMLSVIPLSYICLKFEPNPSIVFIVQLLMTALSHIVKLLFVKKMTGIPLLIYAKKVYIPSFLVLIISPIIPYHVYNYLQHNIFTFLLTGILCILCVSISIYGVGLEKNERKIINAKIKTLISKI